MLVLDVGFAAAVVLKDGVDVDVTVLLFESVVVVVSVALLLFRCCC